MDSSTDIPSIRVLFCGEAGVGKTTIAELATAATASSLSSLPLTPKTSSPPDHRLYVPTVGCSVLISKLDLDRRQECFLEIFDVGGAPRYASSRDTFYEKLDAVVFFWDCNMEGTYHSLENWLAEIKVLFITLFDACLDDSFEERFRAWKRICE